MTGSATHESADGAVRKPLPAPAVMDANEDQGRRDIAASLERDHPHWLVLFGSYSRQYVAFPRFTAPPGTVLAAMQPGELVRRMQRIAARFTPPAA